eukprot:TRINITY_DN5794_c0_g1_i2.p1 TRINITY_DN5794_c0_g1~~TRINITY_DN5794_c0_g1_i2.p1  ORF type:complete len:553 (-),score=127.90 TRINITY_DN5794_c0_g1_i2:44-1570(-)
MDASISKEGKYMVFINENMTLDRLTIGGESSLPKICIKKGIHVKINSVKMNGGQFIIEENGVLEIESLLEISKFDVIATNRLIVRGEYRINLINIKKGTLYIESSSYQILPPVTLSIQDSTLYLQGNNSIQETSSIRGKGELVLSGNINFESEESQIHTKTKVLEDTILRGIVDTTSKIIFSEKVVFFGEFRIFSLNIISSQNINWLSKKSYLSSDSLIQCSSLISFSSYDSVSIFSFFHNKSSKSGIFLIENGSMVLNEGSSVSLYPNFNLLGKSNLTISNGALLSLRGSTSFCEEKTNIFLYEKIEKGSEGGTLELRSHFNYTHCLPNKNLDNPTKTGKLVFSGSKDYLYEGKYFVKEIKLSDTAQVISNGNASIYGNLLLNDFSRLIVLTKLFVYSEVFIDFYSVLSLNTSYTSQFDSLQMYGSSSTLEFYLSKYFNGKNYPMLHVNQKASVNGNLVVGNIGNLKVKKQLAMRCGLLFGVFSNIGHSNYQKYKIRMNEKILEIEI